MAAAPPAPANPQLRRQVASLLVVRASGHPSDRQRRYPRWELDNASLQRLLAAGVGGVILLGGSAGELRLRTRQLQAWSEAPLLLCADVEEGVGQRFEGASPLLPPLALAALHQRDPAAAVALAERYGRCSGREARALGLNWVLAPVCDVNNNPANPVINVRAWGEDPATAAALASAFLRGAQAEGVLCCAKHFPGHGDTDLDSHLELPRLNHSRARLEAVELPPFREAIAAGVASVMTAHLLLPALDEQRPATLSPAVLTTLLRGDLGFSGLVVTDALVMEAISGRYGAGEAAVLALEAGADLVLMPADADAAIEAILAAIGSGRLSRERIEASQERRRRALAALPPPSPAEQAPSHPLGILANGPLEEDQQLAQELVQVSLERQGTARLSPPAAGGLNLIRLDNALASAFLPASAPALEWPAAAGLRACLLEARSLWPWSGDPLAPLALERLGEGPVLLQLFVRGNPFRGSAGGDQEPWEAVIRQLLAAGRLAGLAVYGSPYLWRQLRGLLDDRIPAAYSPGQMPLAQEALLAALGLEKRGEAGAVARRADDEIAMALAPGRTAPPVAGPAWNEPAGMAAAATGRAAAAAETATASAAQAVDEPGRGAATTGAVTSSQRRGEQQLLRQDDDGMEADAAAGPAEPGWSRVAASTIPAASAAAGAGAAHGAVRPGTQAPEAEIQALQPQARRLPSEGFTD